MGNGADAIFYYIYLNIYIIIFYEHRGGTEEGVRKTVSVSVSGVAGCEGGLMRWCGGVSVSGVAFRMVTLTYQKDVMRYIYFFCIFAHEL